MQKWTSATAAASAASNGPRPTSSSSSVSLSRVLEARRGPLNEVECWALLSQAGGALQDVLLGINGNRSNNNNHEHDSSSSSSHSSSSSKDFSVLGLLGKRKPPLYSISSSLVVTPDKLLCTASGKVVLEQNHHSSDNAKVISHYVPSRLRQKSDNDLTEVELEAIGVFSLGRTIADGLDGNRVNVSESLRNLLDGMTREHSSHHHSSVTLLTVMRTVSEQWRLKVGSSPVSRFVSQLCRVTLGWQHSRSAAALSAVAGLSAVEDRLRRRAAAAGEKTEAARRASALPSPATSTTSVVAVPPPLPARNNPTTSSRKEEEGNRSRQEEEERGKEEEEEVVEFSRLDASSSSSSNEASSSSPTPQTPTKQQATKSKQPPPHSNSDRYAIQQP